VAALLVVEVAGLTFVRQFVLRGDFVPRLAAENLVTSIAPRAAFFLEGGAPDQAGLNNWLQEVAIGQGRTPEEPGRPGPFSVAAFSRGDGRLFVLDRQQRLLAGVPLAEGQVVGAPFDTASVPDLPRVLPAALAGDSTLEHLYLRTPDDRFLVAAPIRDSQGEVLGALVFASTLPELAPPYGNLLALLGTSAVVFTLAAGLVGTFFGFLTARGLTRRLRGVAQSAATWGQGDFSPTIQDTSPDELGQLARQLNAMAVQLEDVMRTRQQLATLEERNRLARDLHDSVKQQVFAISMHLGSAQALHERDPEQAWRSLDTASALAREAQGELSTLIQTLRPVQLEEHGLAQALRAHVQTWEKQSGIATSCQVQGSAAVPHAVEQALFRVAQEALANVVRHSGATAASLILSLEPGGVRLQVQDNGSGFDPAQPQRGLGLRSMRERIEALGGTFTLESGARGTQLSAFVPLEPGPASAAPASAAAASAAPGTTASSAAPATPAVPARQGPPL
jgi:NarL family two-component system sensor histidine kinase LiaS